MHIGQSPVTFIIDKSRLYHLTLNVLPSPFETSLHLGSTHVGSLLKAEVSPILAWNVSFQVTILSGSLVSSTIVGLFDFGFLFFKVRHHFKILISYSVS